MKSGEKLKLKIYYIDGKFVPEDKAVIPVDDLAVLRGFGVCDLMRTYNGKPYFFNEHIKRLEHSAKEIGLELPWSREDIINIVLETLKRNGSINEANIRIVITGGSSPDFFTPQGNPRLLVLVTQIPELPASWYEKGVKVITISIERDIPGAKSIYYIPATMALKKAKKEGAVEALYVDRQGFVREGATSNFFAFINGCLVTPDKDVLKGITRQAVLDIAKKYFKTELRRIALDELFKAEEVFITGTNKGVVPVVMINNTKIGDGKPGKNTNIIIDALNDYALSFK